MHGFYHFHKMPEIKYNRRDCYTYFKRKVHGIGIAKRWADDF